MGRTKSDTNNWFFFHNKDMFIQTLFEVVSFMHEAMSALDH
jgi:hypothetical protein